MRRTHTNLLPGTERTVHDHDEKELGQVTSDKSYADLYLVAYLKKHVRCNVLQRGDKEYPKLGRWVNRQRQPTTRQLQPSSCPSTTVQ
jgi:hypothetical protein